MLTTTMYAKISKYSGCFVSIINDYTSLEYTIINAIT